jgi:hypothetical protein
MQKRRRKLPFWNLKGRRKNLPFWGMLLIWLIMSAGFAAYSWFLVRQDELVAPRERVVWGTIHKMTHWKSNKAFYSFTFAGKEYHGNEIVPPDQYCCDVVVYLDPARPSTCSLVEFHHKSKQDRSVMKGCTYAAVGLAAALAFTLLLKWKRKKDALEAQAILLTNR